MKKLNLAHIPQLLKSSFSAVLAVTVTVLFLLLVRRDVVGEGVIALILLFPVIWSAYQWGLIAGMSAAISAALAFDFLFIPPYYTFTIGSLEGWLILGIFFAVAIIVVERIQSSLSRARVSEREAVMMYELSTLLANQRTFDAIAHSAARFVQQHYLAAAVIVLIHPKGFSEPISAQEPHNATPQGKPSCTLPLLNTWGLVGEIQIWASADIEVPSVNSRIMRNIALQVGLAVERVQITTYELQQAVAQQTQTGEYNTHG